jgi:hypothetical protein
MRLLAAISRAVRPFDSNGHDCGHLADYGSLCSASTFFGGIVDTDKSGFGPVGVQERKSFRGAWNQIL